PASPPLARALVRQTLAGTQWEPRLSGILPAVEELVRMACAETDAVTTMRIDSRGDSVRITVRGPSPATPRADGLPSVPKVEAVADAWGAAAAGGGVDVWFEVAADGDGREG